MDLLRKVTSPSRDPERARPAFAESFPRDPELDRLVDRFARGDHASVRAGAEALAGRTDDPAVAAAARALRARLEPDRLAWVLLLAPAVLLLVLTVWAVRRGHEAQTSPAPRVEATLKTPVSGAPKGLPSAPR
jgi:hypothetical protein